MQLVPQQLITSVHSLHVFCIQLHCLWLLHNPSVIWCCLCSQWLLKCCWCVDWRYEIYLSLVVPGNVHEVTIPFYNHSTFLQLCSFDSYRHTGPICSQCSTSPCLIVMKLVKQHWRWKIIIHVNVVATTKNRPTKWQDHVFGEPTFCLPLLSCVELPVPHISPRICQNPCIQSPLVWFIRLVYNHPTATLESYDRLVNTDFPSWLVCWLPLTNKMAEETAYFEQSTIIRMLRR